ncbi:immunoglobulin superfamily member 5 isoform X5 [Eublepharis macularius]|uniref:immunoglobulin superfamily member 5 isoform X5 n=1 Tax=Eublepharis macularius TaxID=481883 RepID=UPI0024102C4B|nr:immunoglobulin superfamily member 5 isoform X5 [Eublepharis macularius]
MDRLQKSFLVTLSLLALLTDPGSGFSITEGPSNVTALAGTEARFNCTVTEGWQILIWLFEGQPVLSVTYPGKAIITDKSYSQQGYNKSTEFTSELTIHNVQLNNSGRIECSLQTVSGNQYAFLSVQESNYQKEMRKVSKQNLETVSDSGNENYGYSPEEQKHTKQMSRAPLPPPPADSGFRGPEQDLAVGSASEISTYLSSSSQSLPSISPVPPLYHFNEHSQKHTVQQSRRISQRQSRVISSKIQKPTVHWPQKRKLKPQTKQSNGQHYYTRKVYFQRWQSSGHSTYTKKLTYHPKQSETQDPQRHTQHLRRKYKYPKIQQKKGQHSKSWAQPQHQKAQASERKQLHPSSKTKAPRVQFLL